MGVNTDCVMELSDVSTGNAVITVDQEAENSIIVLQGANAELTTAHIDAFKEMISEADVVLMQLEIPVEVVEYTAKMASEMGKTVILDPAPAVPDLPETLLKYIDVIKPNETELSVLSGMPVTNLEEAAAAAKKLLKKALPKLSSLWERMEVCL